MARLIFYEGKKLLAKRSVLFFLALCFLANVLWIGHRITSKNEIGYSQTDIAKVYEELRGKLSLEYLQEKMNACQTILINGDVSEGLQEYMILSEIYEQVSILEAYESYWVSIYEQSEQRLSSALFSQSGTFSYRNLIVTPRAYEKLKGLVVSADFDGGVLCVTDNMVTDVIVLILVLILNLQIFIAEHENGTWSLLKSMERGRKDLLIAKLASSLLLTIIIVWCFYGCNILAVSQTIGFGDLDRTIQSVEGYFTSTFLLNVKAYLVIFVMARMLAVFCVSCLFIAVCVFARNSALSLVFGTLIYGMEYVLWKSISVNSWLSVLKELNLAALLNTESYFSQYYNINLFSMPVSNFTCGVITCILCGTLGILLAFLRYNHESAIKISLIRLRAMSGLRDHIAVLGKRRRRRGTPHTLMYYEFYKMMIVNKGIFVLLALCIVQIFLWWKTDYYIDEEEFYYRSYSEVLSGELTEEKEQYLEEEAEQLRIIEECDVLYSRYEKGEIDSNQLEYYLNRLIIPDSQKNAFEKAQSQYSNLQMLSGQGRNVDYVYLTPWNTLFLNDMPQKELRTILEAFFSIILLLCASGELERNSSMDRLVTVSNVGSGGVLRRKMFIGVGVALVVTISVFLPDFLSVIQVYGLGDLRSSAIGFLDGTVFSDFPLSMGGYLAFRFLLRGCGSILMSVLMLRLSERLRNRILSILAGVVIFLLPLILYLL